MSSSGPSLIDSWVASAQGSDLTHECSDPSSLKTLSTIHAFALGTGDSIFSEILPSIEQAQFEVLFVTCFWARSSSLDKVSSCLKSLSERALERRSKIRVRICLSSLSLLHKLLHTRSPTGHTYPSSAWVKNFGLPAPTDLNGLDLEVKSIFIQPFSVMHPKFIVVDRKYVYLPSCNVSWENWFEGCLQISGPVVDFFVRFWQDFWASPWDKHSSSTENSVNGEVQDISVGAAAFSTNDSQLSLSRSHASNIGSRKVKFALSNIPSVFLLSPFHSNPQFRPFPWQRVVDSPRTPLNTFLLYAFEHARSRIYIQTPNVTSPPVSKGLLDALKRGVQVHIVTSERLMLLEQLLTAGTTTSRCLRNLKRHFQTLQVEQQKQSVDEEQALDHRLGSLTIEFFVRGPLDVQTRLVPEPVQSHLKLTIVDERVVVLGSGNMDRASWYTSQELGIACVSTSLVQTITSTLDSCLISRKKLYFHGNGYRRR